MLTKSKDHNPNYLAKIVQLGEPIKHPNADRLIGWIIDGNRVWTDLTYETGNRVVYFPLECQINPRILSNMNLYSSAELNSDRDKKGYFDSKGRVRAVKLRGEPSEGIVLKLIDLQVEALDKMGITKFSDSSLFNTAKLDEEFDTVNGELICWKYVPPVQVKGSANTPKTKGKVRQKDILIADQFRFHTNTPQLKKNLHAIQPDDIISITYKLHGTSGVSARVLVNKQLKWYERLLKRLGVNIVDKEYQDIVSSRTVVKRIGIDSIKQKISESMRPVSNGGYYRMDVWTDAHSTLSNKIQDGMTLYYEIVGYLPGPMGSAIQKGYDYGYTTGYYGVYIYRITYTNPDGKVFEFSWQQIKDYCNKFGLQHVPELYYGKQRDFSFEAVTKLSPLRETLIAYASASEETKFLTLLEALYLEKDCHMCKNKVPAEGVVVKKDGLDLEAYKLKSFRFLEHETRLLDQGEVDIESQQNQEEDA